MSSQSAFYRALWRHNGPLSMRKRVRNKHCVREVTKKAFAETIWRNWTPKATEEGKEREREVEKLNKQSSRVANNRKTTRRRETRERGGESSRCLAPVPCPVAESWARLCARSPYTVSACAELPLALRKPQPLAPHPCVCYQAGFWTKSLP